MKLIDLDAQFIRYETRIETRQRVLGDPVKWKVGDPTEEYTGPHEYRYRVATLDDAQGVQFQCPKCQSLDSDRHYCEVTFANRGVRDEHGCHNLKGVPTRWTVSGTGLHDLTTRPSILLQGGCNWHGYITNGDAT